MQFVLVIMFFITPPVLGKNRPWALQSTQSIEFDSWDACDDVIRNVIVPAVKSTDTMALTAWCLPKAFKGKEREEFAITPQSTEAARSKAMTTYGSCYDFVPAPGGKRESAPAVNAKPIGQCHKPADEAPRPGLSTRPARR
jgi:hypothetical protein